ncbi:hypothetical protein ONZ45_g16417 [Pleurotus djamor]|nr:hypothetical protein ONZ45_g16417 [Pleurotus djamor]
MTQATWPNAFGLPLAKVGALETAVYPVIFTPNPLIIFFAHNLVPRIPPEIVKVIIKLLGNPDRNLLLPLLLVCRGFYEMTHPLLYESISISSADSSKSFDFRPRFTPSTTVAPERFDQLHESLIQNPSLIMRITTFICCGRVHHNDSDWSSIRSTLPSLIHLRCFAFATSDASMENWLLPPASKLTHLSLRNFWDEMTYVLVRNQPLLEYLELGYIYGGQDQPSSMDPPIILPHLKVLECDIFFFNQLEGLSSLEHLSLLQTDCAPRNSKFMSTLRSFMGDSASWGQLARFCDVVEYLWITNVVFLLSSQ